MSLAILVLAVLALLVGRQFLQSGGSGEAGCEGVREVYERVSFVERSGDVPTAQVYRETAAAVRREAVVAPPAVADDLNRMADAYGRLGALLRGFDPQDESTYHLIETRTGEIEAQEALVDEALPHVDEWLTGRCS